MRYMSGSSCSFYTLFKSFFILYTNMYSSSEEEEDYDCPLCMEELDIADRNFKPCPCGYKVKQKEKRAVLYNRMT